MAETRNSAADRMLLRTMEFALPQAAAGGCKRCSMPLI